MATVNEWMIYLPSTDTVMKLMKTVPGTAGTERQRKLLLHPSQKQTNKWAQWAHKHNINNEKWNSVTHAHTKLCTQTNKTVIYDELAADKPQWET